MTEEEFVDLLTLLVERGDITEDEAQILLTAFVAGELFPSLLPLPPAQATAPVDEDHALELALLLLTLLGDERWEYLRDSIRDGAEANVVRLAATLANSGDVRTWHEEMIRLITAYQYSMEAAGLRSLPSQIDEQGIGERRAGLLRWLYLFAGASMAAHYLDRPYTAAYLANRSRNYLAAGWASFFRNQELTVGNDYGLVVDYVARDDGGTCRPCSQAAADGPYLPGEGPYPGEVCDGGGNCRCYREIRYDPDAYARL